MRTQQDVLRAALTLVLGSIPVKGQLKITPEQRELVADEMMKTYEIDWVIKSEVAKGNPRSYIVGVKSTDLIQSWTFKHLTNAERAAKAAPVAAAVAPRAAYTVAQILELKAAGLTIDEIRALMAA